jgi:5-methyltetrahydrofolate--homocysteine methyltransferase
MDTLVRSETSQHRISADGPVTMIGERINPTGRKMLARALREGNMDYVAEQARQQVAAGADLLDINVGVPGLDEVALLPQVVQLIATVSDRPLCIDTANPMALAAALEVAPRSAKPLVNSVNGEETSLGNVLPLVKDRGAAVIGLTMDDRGIPNDPETRAAIAERIVERAARIGIPTEDVLIDPLVLTVGADANAGAVTLRTIELVRERLGVNINLGATNVSFGLPERPILNQAFLALAIRAGATCMITDAAKLGLAIRAAELLLGRDEYAGNYISMYRRLQKLLAGAS